MKRFVIYLFIALFLLVGCAEPDNQTDDGSKVLDSGTSPLGSWKVEFTSEEQDGIKVEAVSYTLEGDGKKLGFAIMCQSANGNKVYSGAIMAARTSEPFTDGFWDSYIVSAGQESVLMDNAISMSDATEDGWHIFLIQGGYDYLDVKELMNATLLEISLLSTTDDSRETTFTLPASFQTALLKYF